MAARVIAPLVAYLFSLGLVVTSLTAAALSFFVPGLLDGPAVTRGNLRGTALVVMLLGVPSLMVSMSFASRGSARALVVWFGSVGYLLYQAVLFVFGTPFNSLFLPYVAMLSLSIWSLVLLAVGTDVAALAGRFDPRLPVRGIAAYAWVMVIR